MRLFGKESFVGLILTTKKAVAAIVEWSIWVFFCLFASGSSLALISGRCSFDPRLHPLAGGARPIDRPCVGIHAPTVRTYVWGWVICGKMGPLSPERCFATKHPCNEPASQANGRTAVLQQWQQQRERERDGVDSNPPTAFCRAKHRPLTTGNYEDGRLSCQRRQLRRQRKNELVLLPVGDPLPN